MTTYELTIPIKCSTLHRVKNRLVGCMTKVLMVLSLAIIGLVNGLAFYMVIHTAEVTEYIVSSGSAPLPGFQYIVMAFAVTVDFFVVNEILGAYDIRFKIDCLRGDKE